MGFLAGAAKGIQECSQQMVDDMKFNKLPIKEYLAKQVAGEIKALKDHKPEGWKDIVKQREERATAFYELFDVPDNITHKDFTQAIQSISGQVHMELQETMIETKLEDLKLEWLNEKA